MLLAVLLTLAASASQDSGFDNGLPDDPTFFPIGVWLQSPHVAERYRDLGVNLYVGLWEGPTEQQLAALEKASMRAFCAQNEVGLAHDGGVIVGWMQHDEPDNAQRAAAGYGPPTPPFEVVERYEEMRRKDPTRPVLLNLGQGAAWDGWHGRGTRTNHPEDYPEYLKGCDIGSFDIYPVTHTHDDVKGRLEYVGNGVRRLHAWSGGKKPIFACIATGHVDNASVRPTPEQIRSTVWIAIACGASGIVYFVHEFQPKFVEASVFGYPEIAAAVKALNAEIAGHAKVLNGPTVEGVRVHTDPRGRDVAVLVKRDGKALIVFAASMTGEPVKATFTLPDGRQSGRRSGRVAVLGERRGVLLKNRRFADRFEPYAVHHYRVPPAGR